MITINLLIIFIVFIIGLILVYKGYHLYTRHRLWIYEPQWKKNLRKARFFIKSGLIISIISLVILFVSHLFYSRLIVIPLYCNYWNKFIIFILTISFISITFSIAWRLISNEDYKHATYVFVVGSLLTLPLTLRLIDKLLNIEELFHIDKIFSFSISSPLRQFPFELQCYGTIDSFATLEDETDTSKISTLVNNIKTKLQKDTLSFILLIGNADKRNIKSESKIKYYGSNTGLAQARANWVRSELIRRLPQFDSSRIIVLISGPDYVGSSIDSVKLADDRSVKVYVGWR